MSTTTPAGGPAPVPIAEFTAGLLNRYAAAGCRAKTVNRVRRALDLLVDLAGVRTTADLDNEAVRRFIVAQRAKAPEPFFDNMCTLCDALSDAVGWGLLHDPPDIVPPPRLGGRLIRGGPLADPTRDPRRRSHKIIPAKKPDPREAQGTGASQMTVGLDVLSPPGVALPRGVKDGRARPRPRTGARGVAR